MLHRVTIELDADGGRRVIITTNGEPVDPSTYPGLITVAYAVGALDGWLHDSMHSRREDDR